nr:PREDICTED: uncharacterized protein LOC105678219 isoform X1 [Linepithema humile]
MIVLKKFATLFLSVFVILPIYEARFYHGYNSYRQYYNNEMKYPVINNIFKQTNYDHNKIQKVNRFKGDNNHVDFDSNFIFSHDNGFEMRNDINAPFIEDPTPCRNGDFCRVKNENYPNAYVDYILRNNPKLKDNVIHDEIMSPDETSDDHLIFCKSKVNSTYPNKAKTINHTWMWIVQSDKHNLKQHIPYVSCDHTNNANRCRHVSGDFHAQCKQMYKNFHLLAFNSTEKGIYAYFPFPWYCCCSP